MLTAGQVQRGKSQFYGNAALLFFFETVCVRAADGFDQAGFAVIDVTGGSQNNLLQWGSSFLLFRRKDAWFS
jgi:hypothetical protein